MCRLPNRTLQGGIIQNCNANEGGAIRAESSDRRKTALLTLAMNKMIDNTASDGGAVYIASSSPNAINATLAIDSGEISGNIASKGGAVYSFFGKEVVVSGGTLDGNEANGYGGAFYLVGGTFRNDDGMISNNTCGLRGGAVYIAGGGKAPVVTIAGGTFHGNRAEGTGMTTTMGGAICMDAPTSFTMSGGVFSNNAARQGGAIMRINSTDIFVITDGEFRENEATTQNGGALYVVAPTAQISNAVFTGNKASGSTRQGGAVYCSGDATFQECSFTDNSAYSGGAIAVADNGKLTVVQSTLEGNSATNGGAIYITQFADIKTDGAIFANNKGFFAYPSLTSEAITTTHTSNIINTTFTAPFKHAFNNYDIAPKSRGG